MRNDDVRWFLHAAQQAQLPDYAMIGYGYGKGVYCLGREKALDAAIEGYVVAHAKHDPKRGAFCTLAFRAMDSFRKKCLIRNMTHRERLHARMLQESQDRDDDGWNAGMLPSRELSPLEQAEKSERIEIVWRHVAKLSKVDRDILRAIYKRGMNAVEYAKKIKRHPTTAQHQHADALKRLREAMGVTT